MKLKHLTGLVCVLGCLVIIGLWDEQKTEEEQSLKQSQNRVYEFDRTKVNLIEIRKDSEAIKMTMNNGDWQLVTPIESAADKDAIGMLLDHLIDVKYSKVVSKDPLHYSDYGVDKGPTFLLSDGDKSYTTIIGSDAPLGLNVYARIEGRDEVYLVSRSLKLAVFKGTFEFRDKKVVKPAIGLLNQIEFKPLGQDSQKLVFVRDDQSNKWKIQGEAVEIDQGSLVDFVTSLNHLRAKGFIDQPGPNDLLRFDNKSALGQLALVDKNGNRTEIDFAGETGDLLFKTLTENTMMIVDKESRKLLDKALFDFRDRSIVSLNIDQLTRIDVDGEKFTKKGDQWFKDGVLSDPDGGINRGLVEIEFAKALEVGDLGIVDRESLGTPAHIIELYGDGTLVGKLEFWTQPEDRNRYYVRSLGRSNLYIVGPEILNELKSNQSATSPKDTGAKGS